MLLGLATLLGVAWIVGFRVLHVASPAIHVVYVLAVAAAIAHIALHSPHRPRAARV